MEKSYTRHSLIHPGRPHLRPILAALTLALTMGVQAQILFTENFTGGTSQAGFTVQQEAGTCTWSFNNPGSRSFSGAGFDTDFAIFDSDFCGFGGGQAGAYLVSPTFDASAANVMLLSFGQVYRDLNGTEAAVEVWNGIAWTQVYSPVGGNVGDPGPAVTTSVDITAAAGGSTQAQFRFHYAGDWSWFWALDHIVLEGMDCIYPPGAAVLDITSTDAHITWTDNGSVGYEWVITTGDEPDGSNAVASGDGNNMGADGLMPNTNYMLFVRSDCGNGGFSGWSPGIPFTTLCSSTTVPYFEDFNSVAPPALPNCMSIDNISGNPWQTNAYPPAGMTGNAARISWTPSGSPDMNSWLFTQGLQLQAGTSYRLTYKFTNSSSSFVERMASAYGTATNGAAMTTFLRYHDEIQTTDVLVDTIDFTPAATGVYYIGFQCYSQANQLSLYLDDIKVVVSPTCEQPNGTTLVQAFTDGVDFTWNASASDPAEGYEWEVRSDGNPGDPNPAASGTVAAGVTSASATGLDPDTQYTVYVRANCGGGDLSYWADEPLVFHTLCLSTAVPYMEDFESVTVPAIPNCMSIETLSGNPWTTTDAPLTPGFTGKAARVSYTPSNSPPMDSWLFTQGLELTGGTPYRLTYKYANYLTSYTEAMGVFYGEGATAASMSVPLADHPTINNNAANTNVVDFMPAVDGTYYIGFKCYSTANQFYLYLDDISVIVLDNCSGTPDPGLTTGPANICAGTAFTLSISNDPGQVGGYTYQWETSADGNTWSNASGNSTEPTYTTTQAETTWYRVQMTCATGGTAASTPLEVVINPPTDCYCESEFTDVSFEHITQVTYAGINNPSAGDAGGPVDYTAQVAQVELGGTDTLSVTIFADGSEYVYAFIDWNHNGILNDAGEVYTLAAGVDQPGPFHLAITVPADAQVGTTRMRVMLAYAGTTPDPCTSATFGEAEDYGVEISPASAVVDCEGVEGGPALPGTPCIAASGFGGIWSNDCVCAENVGVAEIVAYNGLAIHPNPASTELFITTPAGRAAHVKVFDALGQLIIERAQATRLDITNLAPGNYSLLMMDETGRAAARTRFVKQ